MQSISSLFNTEYLNKKEKKGANSERASVVEFFVENVRQKNGKEYQASFIAFKLSHLSLADLYYMKSCAIEYQKKGGEIGKYFFGSLKSK